MKIKKFKYVALSFLAVGMTLSSCDDFLDELPDNRMELKDGQDITDLLVSAYATTNPAWLLEKYSDNNDHFDQTGWNDGERFEREAYNWEDITDVSFDETPQELWQSYYKAIAAANQALQAIQDNGGGSEYNAQRGEALVCRAYNMFVLANVFCNAYSPSTATSELGLPYPTQPEEHVGTQYDRGTLKELYDQINADLEEGLPLLEDQYNQPKFHFTRNAGYAFAAQFNLYYCNYSKAISYADNVLGVNTAMSLRDWSTWYGLSQNGQVKPNAYVSSTEDANLLLINFYSQWGVWWGPFGVGNEYAHGQMISNNETINARGPWGAGNFRNSQWRNASLSKVFVNKIPYSFEITDQQAQIGYAHSELPVFNTDKLLLYRAEAKALNGDLSGAIADLNLEIAAFSAGSRGSVTLETINDFYNGLADYTPTSPTAKKPLHPVFGTISAGDETNVIQAILQLRRYLTLGEGDRMQDIKRYGIVIYRRTLTNQGNTVSAVTDSLTVNDPRRAIQLPQDVVSSGMTPNVRSGSSQPQPVIFDPGDINSSTHTIE